MKNFHMKIQYDDRASQLTGLTARSNSEAIQQVMNSLSADEQEHLTGIVITYAQYLK
ncbi:MAG: hypothetical protein ABS904_00840 [Solibacillus isronensis]